MRKNLRSTSIVSSNRNFEEESFLSISFVNIIPKFIEGQRPSKRSSNLQNIKKHQSSSINYLDCKYQSQDQKISNSRFSTKKRSRSQPVKNYCFKNFNSEVYDNCQNPKNKVINFKQLRKISKKRNHKREIFRTDNWKNRWEYDFYQENIKDISIH